jgi:hypothetical protein
LKNEGPDFGWSCNTFETTLDAWLTRLGVVIVSVSIGADFSMSASASFARSLPFWFRNNLAFNAIQRTLGTGISKRIWVGSKRTYQAETLTGSAGSQWIFLLGELSVTA